MGSKEIISHLRSDFLSFRDLLASSLLVYTLDIPWFWSGYTVFPFGSSPLTREAVITSGATTAFMNKRCM